MDSGVFFEREKGIRVWYMMMCEGRRRRRKREGKNERGGGSIDAMRCRFDGMFCEMNLWKE